MRDSRNPRRGGRRHTLSDLLWTARSFDTRLTTIQVAPTHRCLPSEMARRTGRTFSLDRCDCDFVRINDVSSDITPARIMSAPRRAPSKLAVPPSLQVCALSSYVSRLVSARWARSKFDRIAAGTRPQRFVAL